MIFKKDCTLPELLELYHQEQLVDKIPESIREEPIGIYGTPFLKAVDNEELWIDEAVAKYFASQKFLDDLKKVEEEWNDRRTEFNDYWILLSMLEWDSLFNTILNPELFVYMDLKEF